MIKILAGSASQDFAQRVASAYGTELVPVTTTRFSDGEFTVSIEETVRGKEVVIVQYGSNVGGSYEYGHLLTNNEKDRQDQNAVLMASYMDLSNEIELYTTEE